VPASGSRLLLPLAILCLASVPAFAGTDDTDTDTDTDTDVEDTDVDDTGLDVDGPTYAAHDLAGEDGGGSCWGDGGLTIVLLPLALGLPALRRRR